jgi:4-methyl-5(b-hydroxyethyl)-thiazole monophosphate biosynthesis
MVLAKAGVLAGRPATAHASVRERLGTAELRPSQRVVRSDRVFTSQGPGTSIEFALEVAAELVGREQADQLARAMVVGSQ